jgi:hypothetical protein
MSFWQNLGLGWLEQFRIHRGYQESLNSLRAPIYYDSNDTAYYTDPASTSNLNALNVGGSPVLREDNVNIIRYRGSLTSQDWNTYIDGTEAGYNSVINMSGSNTPPAYTYGIALSMAVSGQGKAQLYFPETGSSSNGIYVRTGWHTSYRDWRSIALHNVNPQTGGSLYASTFYDSGNTGYYLDADSTSNLYNLSLIGAKHTYLQINPGSSHESMVRYMGSAGSSWYVGKRTATQNGISTSDFHWFSQAAGITVAGVTTSGIVQSVGSMRAPIFYDSDNTAYYTDPATATNLNGNTRITNTKFGVSTTGSFNYSTGYGFHTIENGGSNEPVCMFYHQVGTTAVQQYGINIISAANHNNTTSRFMLGQGGSSEKIKIYSNGNIQNTNNSYGQLSDINLKENIVDATSKLDEINQIRVVNFNYIGDIDEETNTPNKQIGVIAQEVEQIFPGLVYECGDTETITKAVKYSVFVPMMLKAIQELKADNDSLKARIETLENN